MVSEVSTKLNLEGTEYLVFFPIIFQPATGSCSLGFLACCWKDFSVPQYHYAIETVGSSLLPFNVSGVPRNEVDTKILKLSADLTIYTILALMCKIQADAWLCLGRQGA